ncbi:MAG: hypothetical protein M0Q88_07015 [Bacilli bacterium]|nr:hypothetical protein [Bacilli bacterium]
MALYNTWQNINLRTSEHYTYRLFSHLSPDYYPVHVKGTEIYNILEMYGREFATSSIELYKVAKDLDIRTARTSPISSNNLSKLYENFGTLVETNKFFNQNYDTFNSATGSFQSYRQMLRLLYDAVLNGGTDYALNRIGHAYTGVAPIIVQPIINEPRWQLTTYTGSVISKGDNFFVLDKELPIYGNIFVTEKIDEINVGQTIVLTKSKLGFNTKLFGSKDFYGGIYLYVFAHEDNLTDSFKDSIENHFNMVSKGDVFFYPTYSSNYKYWRPTTSQIANFSLITGHYLINTARTSPTGAILKSDILELPTDYLNYDWYYDWLTLSRNEAYYIPYVRQYPSSSIPDTVKFIPVTGEILGDLPFPEGTQGVRWIFDKSNRAEDISGNPNAFNLDLNTSYGTGAIPVLSRKPGRLGVHAENSSLLYEKMSGSFPDILAANQTFFIEAWIKGLDKIGSSNMSHFTIKNSNTEDQSNILTDQGMLFSIDFPTETMKFEISYGSGLTYSISGSISNLLNEDPSRYHYVGVTKNYTGPNDTFLFVDDEVIATGSVYLLPPAITNSYTAVIIEGTGIGVDEISIQNGYLTPESLKTRFLITQPRLNSYKVNRTDVEKFQQGMVKVFASGSGEFEWHQFSIRGIEERLFDYIPVFPTGSLPHINI